MGCIYCARNKVNGKKYVGKTVLTIQDRRAGHERDAYRGSQFPFHRALRKYGSENFSWRTLFVSNKESLLFRVESEQILSLRSKSPNGYNLTNGGDGVVGYKRTKADRRRISVASKIRGISVETRAKMAASLRGRRHSSESKAKISSSLLGHNTSAETRAKIGAANRGRVHSLETRAKLSRLSRIRGPNKGAFQPGENNPSAKLTPRKVLRIRHLLSQDMPRKIIAQMFGVSIGPVSGIAQRKLWRRIQ